jgi:hypothetical protein
MLSWHRGTCATVAVMALVSLAAVAPVSSPAEELRHEHPAPERTRKPVRREPETRHRAYVRHEEPAHVTPGHTGAVQFHPITAGHPSPPPPSAAMHALSANAPGSQMRTVGYGNSVTRSIEHTVGPGLVSRTFLSGGHIVSTRLYQSHIWHQFNHAFAYETFVSAVRYPVAYYSWALSNWSHPIAYQWGWQAQPWYPTYGLLFVPYPVYSSPDLWMTDYILSQSMQTAYLTQSAPPASQGSAAPAQALAPGAALPPAPASEPTSAPQPGIPPVQPRADATPAAPAAPTPLTPTAPPPNTLPPVVTPAVKAQLDTQIKVQLQDRQTAAATPATLRTESTPPALRPNHLFFEVVQHLDVASDSAAGHCTLSPNDYIKRTGGLSQDDWMIPVVVELSAPSDCPAGLHTRIGLNDLNAMENEQEAQVMDALQAASKSMGPNGPPGSPAPHSTLIAARGIAQEPSAIQQSQ